MSVLADRAGNRSLRFSPTRKPDAPEWVRATGSGYTKIPNASSDIYVLTSADVGAAVACIVTGHNRSGSLAIAADSQQQVSAKQSGGGNPPTTPQVDTEGPRSFRSNVSCDKGECQLSVGVEDAQPSSGVVQVRATVSLLKDGRLSGRRKTISAREQSPNLWTFDLPRFHRSDRMRVRVRSEDAAGNVESPPLTVILRRK